MLNTGWAGAHVELELEEDCSSYNLAHMDRDRGFSDQPWLVLLNG